MVSSYLKKQFFSLEKLNTQLTKLRNNNIKLRKPLRNYYVFFCSHLHGFIT